MYHYVIMSLCILDIIIFKRRCFKEPLVNGWWPRFPEECCSGGNQERVDCQICDSFVEGVPNLKRILHQAGLQDCGPTAEDLVSWNQWYPIHEESLAERFLAQLCKNNQKQI